MKKDKDGIPFIFHYAIWTDNSPIQYRNRFHFMYCATIHELFPGRYLRLLHYFAQKFRFKGCWDADGRIDKYFVKKRALAKECCRDALDFFRQISKSDFQFIIPRLIDPEEQFCEWIGNKDPRVRKNTANTINTREYKWGCDVADEYPKVCAEFGKKNIVFIDRLHFRFEYDITPVTGSSAMYAFIGPKPGNKKVAPDGTPIYTMTLRSAPCGCSDCRIGGFEDCKYE